MIRLKTISIYLFSLYCQYFLVVSLILTGILVLSNIFDVLQRFKDLNLSLNVFWRLVLYKVPYLLNQIAALVSFISMAGFLVRLVRNNELIVILSSGISIWRVLIVPAAAALTLGVIIVSVLNPAGSYGLQQYQILEAQLTKKTLSTFGSGPSGEILFFEKSGRHHQIIKAQSVDLALQELTNVTIFFINADNDFSKRLDAKKARLNHHQLTLSEVQIITNDSMSKQAEMTISTNWSIDHCLERSPEMISVWQLPGIIDKLLKSGAPVINYQLNYYKQLLKPLMMAATVILAACFFSLQKRHNVQSKIVASGLLVGFAVYWWFEVTLRILAYRGIEPFLAVLLPIILIILISNFVVLHFHQA